MNALISGFQGGELSPLLEGRGDLEALRNGCRRLRNMIPLKLGAAFQRPGTLFLGRAHQESGRVRLLSYVYSQSVTYFIELGERYARFWRDGSLVRTRAGVPDGSGVSSAVGDPLVLSTPWSADEVFELQAVSANDVVWLTHRSHWPRRLVRHGAEDWRIEEMRLVFPPLRDLNAAEITLAASAASGEVTLTAQGGDVFDPGDVGGYYGISHRRDLPVTQFSLSQGSAVATQLLTLTEQPAVNETITIGGVTYVFKDHVVHANEIARGGTLQAAYGNLLAAINGGGGGYGPGTVAHPQVTAEDAGDITDEPYATARLTINENLFSGADVYVNGVKFTAKTSSPDSTDFLIGWDKETTLDNIIAKVNSYFGSQLNNVAQFGPRLDNTALLTATAPGDAGNQIEVGKDTGGGGSTNWLVWETNADSTRDHTGAAKINMATSLKVATKRLRIYARTPGAEGNNIYLNSVLAAAGSGWDGTEPSSTQGGRTLVRPSDGYPVETLRINGGWEVYTYGRWYGTLRLELQRAPDVWETVRAWDSKNDLNVQASGTVEGEQTMRLTYTGTGTEADGAEPRATLTAVDAVVTGVVRIDAVNGPREAQGTVVRPLHAVDPTYDWAEGAWSRRRGFPAAVALHEQRLVFGRDKQVWGSQLSGFDNFERLPLEDSAWAYSLAAAQGNQVQALLSHRGLIVLTDGDEWLLDGGPQSPTITPTQIRAERKSGYGSAAVPPVLMQSSVFFVQQGGTVLNEYVFDFQQDGYEAVDLTELAGHLAAGRFVSMAWAPNPHGVLWAVTAEGALLSMTYRRGGGGTGGGVIAWAQHSTPGGSFESVAVAPGADGISEVWLTVQRRAGSAMVRSVERFDPAHWAKVHAGGGWINVADGAVVCTQPGTFVSGLAHLEDCTVGVLVDGAVQPDKKVEHGGITLSAPLTSYAVAGLPVTAELQPMPLEVMLADGAATGRKFRTGRADVRFYRTGACEYADAPEGPFYPVPFRTAADATGQPVPPHTGLKKLDNAGGYTDGTRVMLRNRTLLPLHVLSLVLETTIHGD